MERMKQLAKDGQLPKTLAETCRVLVAWLEEKYPGASRPGPRSLENSIRAEYRRLQGPIKPGP
jgi:hypothetical protein